MVTVGRDSVRAGVRSVDEALGRMRSLVPGLEGGDLGTADVDLIRAAFVGLPYDDQRLLWLKHVDAVDDHVAAARLGIPLGSVQRRLRRAEHGLSAGFAAAHARAVASATGACATTRRSLGDYVRHRLPARARTVLEEHLFGCQDCMRALIDVRQAGWTLRDAAPLLLSGGAGLAAAGHVVVGAAGATTAGKGGLAAFLGAGAGLGAVRDRVLDGVRALAHPGSHSAIVASGSAAGVVVASGVVAVMMLGAGAPEPAPVGLDPEAPVVAAPEPARSAEGVTTAPTPEPSAEPAPAAAPPSPPAPAASAPSEGSARKAPAPDAPATQGPAPEAPAAPAALPTPSPAELPPTSEPSPPAPAPEPSPSPTPEPSPPEPSAPATTHTVVVRLPPACGPDDPATFAVSLAGGRRGSGLLSTRDADAGPLPHGVVAWPAHGTPGIRSGAWVLHNLTCQEQRVTFTLAGPADAAPTLVPVGSRRR